MAKTVKFNLKFGETSIRTVEDLRENFVMDDVLDCFDNGLLLKFLQRRGYTEHAQKIAELSARNAPGSAAARELTEIFDIDYGKEALDEYEETLKLRREKFDAYAAYAKGKAKEQVVIQKYIADYLQIVNQLIEYKDELGKIEALVWELIDAYMPVLLFDWRVLFFNLCNNGALYPICHMITYDFFRERWLTKDDHEVVKGDREVITKRFIAAMGEAIQTPEEYPWINKCNKADANYWEDIEAAGKTYMILNAPAGAKIRAYGDIKNEIAAEALTDSFITLDGIQYRHNASDEYLYYAEV